MTLSPKGESHVTGLGSVGLGVALALAILAGVSCHLLELLQQTLCKGPNVLLAEEALQLLVGYVEAVQFSTSTCSPASTSSTGLSIELALWLNGPGYACCGLLLLCLEPHLLLVLLHHTELVLQLLQQLLLLWQETGLVLKVLEGLQLRLSQVEGRPLLRLWSYLGPVLLLDGLTGPVDALSRLGLSVCHLGVTCHWRG